MKQYAADFRDRLRGAIDAGLDQAEAARTCGVHRTTIARWRVRREGHGSAAPTPRPGRARCIPPSPEAALRAQVAARPDATLAAHCDRGAQDHGVRVCTATMARTRARLDRPLKTRP